MRSNTWKIKLYQISYRYHRIVWFAVRLMVILLSSIAILWSAVQLMVILPPSIAILWTQYYPAIAGWQFQFFYLACLVAFVWLVISRWYAVWFRDLVWWVSRGAGALRRWLNSGWRPAVILLLFATIVMYWRYQFIGPPHNPKEFLTAELGLKVAAVAALLAMLYWAYQARSRTVILSFTDYTGDKDLEASIKGVSAQLLDELARLNDLYKTISEAAPTDDKETSIRVTIGVESAAPTPILATILVKDAGQFLKDAVTPETKVKLGPLL